MAWTCEVTVDWLWCFLGAVRGCTSDSGSVLCSCSVTQCHTVSHSGSGVYSILEVLEFQPIHMVSQLEGGKAIS